MSINLTFHKPLLAPLCVTAPSRRSSGEDVISRKLPFELIMSMIQFLEYPDLLSFDVVSPAWHNFLNHALPLQSNIALKRLLLCRTLNSTPHYTEYYSKECLSKEIAAIMRNMTKLPEHAKTFLEDILESDLEKKFSKYGSLLGTIDDYAFFSYHQLIFVINKFSGSLVSKIDLFESLNSKESQELDDMATREQITRTSLHSIFFKIAEFIILSKFSFIVISNSGLVSCWEIEKSKYKEELKEELKEESNEAPTDYQKKKFVCTKSQLIVPISEFDPYQKPYYSKINSVFNIGEVVFLDVFDNGPLYHPRWYSFVVSDSQLNIQLSNFQFKQGSFQGVFVGPNTKCFSRSLHKPTRNLIWKHEVDQETGKILFNIEYEHNREVLFNYLRLESNDKYLVGCKVNLDWKDYHIHQVNVWDVKTKKLLIEFPRFYSRGVFKDIRLIDNFFIYFSDSELRIYDIVSQKFFPRIAFSILKCFGEELDEIIILNSYVIIILKKECTNLRKSVIYKFKAKPLSKPKIQKTCLLM